MAVTEQVEFCQTLWKPTSRSSEMEKLTKKLGLSLLCSNGALFRLRGDLQRCYVSQKPRNYFVKFRNRNICHLLKKPGKTGNELVQHRTDLIFSEFFI